MHQIFISYRRIDAQGHAGRLFDRLKEEFGSEALFYDQDSIRTGEIWSQAIDEAVRACKIVIILVGEDWLSASNQQGERRLDQEGDVVRREICLALELKKDILPIRIEETPIPAEDELPECLRALLKHDFEKLSNRQGAYDSAIEDLKKRILGILSPGSPAHDDAEMLPYLCDRSAQETELRRMLDAHLEGRRPMVCVVYGGAYEAHGAFMDRLENYSLPREMRSRGGGVHFLRINRTFECRSEADFSREFRSYLAEELQFPRAVQSDDDLLQCLTGLRARLVCVVMVARSREATTPYGTWFELIRGFWEAFPELPSSLSLITFVCLKLESKGVSEPTGFLGSLWRSWTIRDLMKVDKSLRKEIESFDASAAERKVVCKVLPELGPAGKADVEQWGNSTAVRRKFKLTERTLQMIFRETEQQPMEIVIDKLSAVLSGAALEGQEAR
jgi:hypothetical protein